MASSPDAVNLQVVRALAHELYAQCTYMKVISQHAASIQRIAGRDSVSSFRLLTTPVRKLRNVLEEAEEIFDETRTLGPDDLRLLEKADKSRGILHQLDLALHSYRSSNYVNVNENAIADFKTLLDVTTHELELAFEAITTGEIPLRLDTDILPYGTGTSKSPMRGPSSSSNATDSAHDRKSSRTSSAWSLVPRDHVSQDSTSDSMSVRSENKTERQPSDEKQLYDYGGMNVQASPSTGSAVEKRPSLDWRSPFASPDPLSISIEEASAMILAEDEEEVTSSMRSRSGTGSTVFADANKHDDQAHVGLGLTSSLDAGESTITSTSTLHPNQQSDVRIENYGSQIVQDDATGESASPSKPDRNSAPQNLENARTRALSLTPAIQDETGHLSPKSAATEFARKKRSSSISSLKSANKDKHSPIEPGNGMQVEHESDLGQENKTSLFNADSTTRSSVTVQRPRSSTEGLQRVSTVAYGNIQKLNPPKPIPPWPAFDAGVKNPEGGQASADSTPAMPKRQPPPPPPKPRRSSATVRASTYRIVNASPLDSPSSEDELYTTSKPSSPTAQMRTAPRIDTNTTIPEVSIDASACEEDTGKDYGAHIATESANPSESDTQATVNEQSGMSILANALRSKFSIPEPSTSAVAQAETKPLEVQPHRSTSNSSATRRHSIAVPPSQDTSKENAPALPPRPTPPPVPKRPSQQRYRRASQNQSARPARPAPSTTQTSPAVIHHSSSLAAGKELAPESGLEVEPSGLEVQDKLDVGAQPKQLRQRVSVDAALNVNTNSLLAQTTKSSHETNRHLRSASTSQAESASSNTDNLLTGFYAPGIDSTSTTELERERINHIIHFWNNCQWDQAEAYLTDYLTALIEEDALARVRRVRHLLGVCASFKGEWSRAFPLFLSVIRTPVRDIAEIDDGDCAAAYWLGDTYAMMNKRTEALLAYCIAERSSLFDDPFNPSLGELITAEQEAVQLGVPKTSTQWAQAFSASPGDSILDPNVVTTSAAMMLFANGPRRAQRSPPKPGSDPFTLSQIRARSHSLLTLTSNARSVRFHRMSINAGHFEPDTPWPMMYDPLFAMANVQRGRLLQYEADLLAVFTTNLEAKIPKSSPLGLTRMDCFTCSDLTWLIQTLRECLKMLEMEFSEVANVEGTWFVARYTFMQNKIATTYYFSIALFKQTLRSGYGVEICPDGICSARIGQTNIDYDKGVHVSESKRIKKLVREYLDEAAKQRPKSKRKEASSEGTPPPLPPRPNI